MLVAITRPVGPRIGECLLTHLARQPIDLAHAREQHLHYEERLTALGCAVQQLPPEPDLPDAVFVEDAAVVLDEVAVIARPGAEERRPETESVADALSRYRPLCRIQAPGTLDGGDVLRLGKALYVGLSGRTSGRGAAQLRELVRPFGYTVTEVPVGNCLHLKSAVTQVAEDTLLVNRSWVDVAALGPLRLIDVDAAEPGAANALLVGSEVLYPAAYPRTQSRLAASGIRLEIVDVSELAKAEGALTCCSLIFAA